jgi:hypothetical protein
LPTRTGFSIERSAWREGRFSSYSGRESCGAPVPPPCAIGLAKQPEYEERTVDLDPSDRLYLYTDGLLEATDESGREFGAERLGEQIRHSREHLRHGWEAGILNPSTLTLGRRSLGCAVGTNYSLRRSMTVVSTQ